MRIKLERELGSVESSALRPAVRAGRLPLPAHPPCRATDRHHRHIMVMMSTDGCWRACLATMLAGAFAVADASAGKPPPPPPAIQFDNTLDDYAVCTHVPSSHAKSARGAVLRSRPPR